jgi:hypothetical protein
MKVALIVLGLLLALPLVGKDEERGALRLEFELEDGCLIIGRVAVTTLAFESPLLGKMQIPLERIATVEFKETGDSIVMRNGDTIQATLAEQALQVETIFGKVQIPRKQITRLKCVAGEGDEKK